MHKDIRHLRELMEQRDRLTQLAINKAEESINERLLKMNEFRAQQADLIARFATTEKLDAVISSLNHRIETQSKEIDELKAYQSTSQGRGQIIQILWPLVVGIVVFVLNKYFK